MGIKRDIRMSNKIVSKYTIPIKANHLTHLKIWHNYPTGKIWGAVGVCSRLLIQYPRFVCICECLPYQRAQGTTYFIEVESWKRKVRFFSPFSHFEFVFFVIFWWIIHLTLFLLKENYVWRRSQFFLDEW